MSDSHTVIPSDVDKDTQSDQSQHCSRCYHLKTYCGCDHEDIIHGQICLLLLRGMKAKVDALAGTGLNPFGEEMRAFDRIRIACHGDTPGVDGSHIFDILEAAVKHPGRYGVIALYRIARVLDEVDMFLGIKVRDHFRRADVAHTDRIVKGKPGIYLLSFWNLNYTAGREHTVVAQ